MTVGTPPQDGSDHQLIEGKWARGVAAGQNWSSIYSWSASGSNQATASQIQPGYRFVEVDTVSPGSGVALPAALEGTDVTIINGNGTNLLAVYPSIINNPRTGAQDTIAGMASASIATNRYVTFICAKNGVWQYPQL